MEDFCDRQGILLSKLEHLAYCDCEISEAIERFKQKQKVLLTRLLSMNGTIRVKNETGVVQEIDLDKHAIMLLAKKLKVI